MGHSDWGGWPTDMVPRKNSNNNNQYYNNNNINKESRFATVN